MTPFGPVITSPRNPQVKLARALSRRQIRAQERAFLVEGVRAIEDAFRSGAVPLTLFYVSDSADPRVHTIASAAAESGTQVLPSTEPVLHSITETEHPQGVASIFPMPELEIVVAPGTQPLVVVADTIRDPGNLGTLIRSALGSGANALFVTPGTVDPFNPKVVRAGMSAHFRLPIRSFSWEELAGVIPEFGQRIAAEAAARTSYDAIDWTQASSLIVGNETAGLSPEARVLATGFASIPLLGGLESLNAGIAGSVILFEAARQRRA